MKNWSELDRALIWHPFSAIEGPAPLVVTKAEGIYLHTADGRRIIDGICSWWVNLHGHSHPAIAKAIYEQATTLEHVIFAGFTHPPAIELAEQLLTIVPSNQKKVFFSDNGSTAVEVAIKMAIQYWHNLGAPRKKIIAIDGAYHGDTFGAMAVGERGPFTAPFHDYLFPVEFISFPGDDQEQAIAQMKASTANDDVAAFIYEPLVQGAAGMRIYSADVLNELMSIARAQNILCIADEVFTGFGRTGHYFATDHLQHQADIMALSKGLTGGTMALGVTTCTQEIQDAFKGEAKAKTFYHGHSFTANPIACAASLASLALLKHPDCQKQIRIISALQKNFALKISSDPSIIKSESLGTLLSIELKTTVGTGYFNSLRDRIYSYFLERGILLRPLGNVLYFLPSYAFTEAEIAAVHGAIANFLNDLKNQS